MFLRVKQKTGRKIGIYVLLLMYLQNFRTVSEEKKRQTFVHSNRLNLRHICLISTVLGCGSDVTVAQNVYGFVTTGRKYFFVVFHGSFVARFRFMSSILIT